MFSTFALPHEKLLCNSMGVAVYEPYNLHTVIVAAYGSFKDKLCNGYFYIFLWPKIQVNKSDY